MANGPVRELITRVKFELDKASVSAAGKAITKLKKDLDTLTRKKATLKVDANTSSALTALRKVRTEITKLNNATANVRVKANTSHIKTAVKSAGSSMASAGSNVGNAMSGIAGAYGGYVGVSTIKEAADSMMNLDGRLRIVTKDEQERLAVEQQLYAIGQNARQPLDELGKLYFGVARASEEMGFTQKDNLRVTETVSKALVVGGASAGEAAATILQLSQALGSGRLQGDELRSLDENASALMKHVAEYFGTNVAGLKEMGAKGELTSDEVMRAILSSSAAIDEEFKNMPMTFGQAMTVMGNSWDKFILGVENKSSVFSTVARGMSKAFESVGKDMENFAILMGTPQNGQEQAQYDKAAAENPGMVQLANTLKEIGTWLDELDGKAGNIDEQIAGWVKSFVKVAAVLAPIITIIGIIDGLIMLLSPVFSMIAAFGSVLSAVWAGVTAAIGYIIPVVQAVIGVIAGFSAATIAAVLAVIAIIVLVIAYWDELKAFVIDVWNSITEKISEAAESFKNTFNNAIEAVKGFFGGLRDYALQVIQEIVDALGNWITEKISWAKGALGDLKSFGSDVFSGIADGVSNAYNSVTNNQTNNVTVSSNEAAASYPGQAWFWD